ncbi:hypothetical protein [Pseudomonas sp. Marseille-P9899]|uniref:hypothetical protein n=1 Tax=Pseudomonas sp. Marseille-P9899 TaxID=2730401 RepID=UPI00158BF9CC|nr:hypothetical protein [Pseudomonas sp. Marseille-P9899]
MNDEYDIDTTGFELGIPTHIEMLEQQCLLMQSEYELVADLLAKAQADIRRLVRILDEAERRRDLAIKVRDQAEYVLTDFRAENARLEKRIEEQQREIRSLKRKLC